MELKLDIYEKRKIVKSYVAEEYDVMFGTVEDLFNVIDFDSVKNGTEAELVTLIAKALPKAFVQIKPLMKDIFEGLTDEELKHVRLSNIAKVLMKVVMFSFSQISTGVSEKN